MMTMPVRPATRRAGLPASLLPALLALCALCAAAPTAAAPAAALPAALTHPLRPLAEVPRHAAPAPDLAALAAEDAQRERDGLPPRFALPSATSLTPEADGAWEPLDAQWLVWRLRIGAPGAVSLNLGFTRFRLPKGGRLCLYPASDPAGGVAFTEADNEEHGQLWTPVVPGDEVVVELTLHAATRADCRLEIGSVNVGYRDFGRVALAQSGPCNIDVVCPGGDPWRDEIQSVAAISTGGSLFCTGFMVNNTAQDARPYFMTANHCGIGATNAPSLVVYWNFQSPTCGQLGGGSLADFQTGSIFRAAYATSDFTLVELDDPPAPDWNVTFAGWDRRGDVPTRATAIHHPSGDEKSISFEDDPLQITFYPFIASPVDSTHLRVMDWDLGTTEGGSSGSPLFDQNHRVVGQLHGGLAACGNDASDWYGRFSVSWDGGGADTLRLSDWLDPLGTGQTTLDLLAPYATGLQVQPGADLVAAGPVGGPFAPASLVYTLANRSTADLAWRVGRQAAWVDVSPASGTLPADSSVAVTVALNSLAADLIAGVWTDTLSFVNETDHRGDQRRPVTIRVGSPTLIRDWPLDADPGWTMRGQWAFGPPRGAAAPPRPPPPATRPPRPPGRGDTPARPHPPEPPGAARRPPGRQVGGAGGLGPPPGRGRAQRPPRPVIRPHRRERARLQPGRTLREQPAGDAPDEPGARPPGMAHGRPALLALARGGAAGVRPRVAPGQRGRHHLDDRLGEREPDRRRRLGGAGVRHLGRGGGRAGRPAALDHGSHRRKLGVLRLEPRRHLDLGLPAGSTAPGADGDRGHGPQSVQPGHRRGHRPGPVRPGAADGARSARPARARAAGRPAGGRPAHGALGRPRRRRARRRGRDLPAAARGRRGAGGAQAGARALNGRAAARAVSPDAR